jgi:selenocysteine lyase/cysteine desulfurase
MLTAATEHAVDSVLAAGNDEAWFRRWRSVELSRLETTGTTYLDYTGAALYPESLVRRDAARLADAVLGNPHSESTASRAATADLEAARSAILGFLNADPAEYVAILTANATAACRLVGEAFPFGPQAPLVLAADNHNSVNGVREFARHRGARVHVVPLDEELRLDDGTGVLQRAQASDRALFAFPAQSNFSGVRHPLALIADAQALGYRVLLDAASFVATGTLDLSLVRPDFVALSLYKIAGYPTGIGALVARREALDELQRPWFSGGTIDWVTVGSGRRQMRSGAERFEDGTPPYLAAGAVRSALAGVIYADRERLARHLETLTGSLLGQLAALRHSGGAPLVAVHGPADARERGATVAITLRDRTGAVIPFWEVEEAAREAGIALRGGCFCNPGCAEYAFGLHAAEDCLDALGRDFTIPGFASCLGNRAVGAVRLSMGLGSGQQDVNAAIEFLGRYLC